MAPKTSATSPVSPAAGAHALVIGGSIAGLLAARVLANHFDRVTIVERDRLPPGPEPRKGIPQARHVHSLLARGLQILEELFPGFDSQLASAGAPMVDWGADAAWFGKPGWSVRFRSGVASRACSRDLLEWLVRSRLEDDPRVRFLTGAEVTGLLASPDPSRVAGVHVRFREQTGPLAKSDESLFARLVVDASGRSSRAPQWLSALGYSQPEETTVNAYLGYATRWYHLPIPSTVDWKLLGCRPEPPDHTRGGVILEVDGPRWVVTLIGVNRDYPPTDETAFLEFARSLPTPALYEVIKAAEPLTPVYGYQRNENRLRHYERLDKWPDGFIVVGDAVCAFNPVYGQGMSVATMAARTLNECLRAWGPEDGLARRFQNRLAGVTRMPWLMATGEDYRWPGAHASRPGGSSRVVQWYVDQVLNLAFNDPQALKAFLQVTHLLKPPSVFFRPGIAIKTIAQALKKPAVASSQPTTAMTP